MSFCMLVIKNQSGVSTMFMITAHVLILTLPISLKFNYSNIIIPFKDLNQVEVNIIQALSEPAVHRGFRGKNDYIAS